MLSLPARCHLHSIIRVGKSGYYLHIGLELNRNDTVIATEWAHDWPDYHIYQLFFHSPCFMKLNQLRLTLSKDSCNHDNENEDQRLTIKALILPALEVLELNVQNNESFWIAPALSLKSFVVIAGGTLRFIQEVCCIPITTLKQIYV